MNKSVYKFLSSYHFYYLTFMTFIIFHSLLFFVFLQSLQAQTPFEDETTILNSINPASNSTGRISINSSTANHTFNRTSSQLIIGWLRKDLCALKDKYIMVIVDTVNVRAGPAQNFAVIKRADFGAIFEVIGEENGWYKFYVDKVSYPSKPTALEEVEVKQKEFLEAYKNYTSLVEKYGRTSSQAKQALIKFRQAYAEYKFVAWCSEPLMKVRAKKATVDKVVISKRDYTATVYIEGKIARVYPIAYGSNPDGKNKVSQGDRRTPEGKFKIVSKIVNPPYTKENIPGGAPNNPLGTRWMGLDTWGGSIGMHGTSNPLSIGTKASKGCIRMFTPDAEELFDLVKIGTPVQILPINNP